MTKPHPRRDPGEHRDSLGAATVALAPDRRPTPGPIAVEPSPGQIFLDAIEAGGTTPSPLSTETRALIWLGERDPEGLRRALAAHPGIEWVQLPWAGVDAFADILSAFSDRPLPLWTSAKSAYAEPVAEHALALTLALLRQIPQKARAALWQPVRTGSSLFGRDVVIVGAGGIAEQLLRLLAPFECAITIVRRSREPMPGVHLTVTTDRLLDVLATADVVIVAAAATSETSKLFAGAEFVAMKKTAILINVARGALVDTDALVSALRSGEIAGAGLDVTDPEPLPAGHPLFSEMNCVITSHSADTVEMTTPLLANRIRRNVEAYLGDGHFVGIVDPAAGY